MRYQIPDDVLPGSRPDKVIHPYVLLLVYGLAGGLAGALLALVNARWLGCADQQAQWRKLGAIWIMTVIVTLSAFLLRNGYEPTDWLYLVGTILSSLTFLLSIMALVFIFDRQIVLYRLHNRDKGWRWMPLGYAIGVVVLAQIVTISVADFALLRRVLTAGQVWG